MLRYWYKLNNDVQNYGMGNEKFVEGGTYGDDYPKLFYKNLLIYAGKNAVNIPAGDDLVYTLTETLTKYSISVWYYVHSSHTNHGNNVHMIKLINGTNYSYIDQFWDPQSTPQWRHLCLTYDGQNQNIYINGVLKEQTDFSEGQITSLGFMDKDEVRGGLTDLKIFDHVLSNKEIEELSTPLLVHIPFNNLSVPSVILSDYVPGQGYVNYTSTLTKDSSVQTGSLPNIPKEWIMEHLGETVCASAYVYSLGSYTAGTVQGIFGIQYYLRYINTNNVEKAVYPLSMFTPGQNGLYYSTWTIPSDIKSCTTDLIINNYTLGVQSNPEFGATPDQYGVTWTFSHFKIEPGSYPSYPFIYHGFEDVTGYEYDGITQFMDACACINDSPRYRTGVRLYGSSGGVIGNIQLSNLKNNYGQFNISVGFTMAIWFKINNMTGSGNTQIFSYYDDIDESGFILHANENAFFLNQHVHNSDTVIGTVVKPCNMNTWYHCVLSVNRSQFKLYINGELQNLSNNSSIIADFTDNSIISINRLHNTDISVSDFRMYKTALSDQKIKDIYNEASSIDDNGDVFSRELIEYEYINLR